MLLKKEYALMLLRINTVIRGEGYKGHLEH